MCMKRKITRVQPQGYCGGVLQAIALAKKSRIDNPDTPITILGNLVHNSYVKKALALYDLKTIEDPNRSRLQLLDDLQEGIVIFTAHGVSPQVYKKAKQKGLRIVDATCPFVSQTQKIVRDHLKQNAWVFYVGKKGHPEAEAIYSSSDHVILIESEQDIPSHIEGEIFVTNQTTMSILELESIFQAIKEPYPHALIHDEICNATRVRQQAILDLKNQNVDGLIVVGDPTSNNTQKLAAIGKKANIPYVACVADVTEIDQEKIRSCQHLAITSGASTPTYLTDQICRFVSSNSAEVEPIDIKHIL